MLSVLVVSISSIVSFWRDIACYERALLLGRDLWVYWVHDLWEVMALVWLR
jgi:hypothetical protein